VLGHYARDVGLFTLEEAVHRMTGLSARQFNLVDRGEIRIGNVADIVVFDAERIIDRATYENPTLAADGIELVMVGGEIAYRDRQPTGMRAGRFLSPIKRK
jgi:N-acyl-D-amino-acid deacylase